MSSYVLMHKNIEVVAIEIDESTGNITATNDIYDLSHVPLSATKDGVFERQSLNGWWITRSIPISRTGINTFLQNIGLNTPKELLVKSLGLSLSDHYWIKPIDQDVKWDAVNFFQNDFSQEAGEILMGEIETDKDVSLFSPENTTDGNLKKRWSIQDGERALIKGGASPYKQEPINEVIASKLMDELGFRHVEYKLDWINENPVSVCPCFVDENTEFVSAWNIINSKTKEKSRTYHDHFIDCVKSQNAKKEPFVHALDEMITLDFLIYNEDRHFGNFGIIRHPETLEVLSMAPLFDNGSSLGYKSIAWEIMNPQNIPCKPFENTHYKEMHLVSKDFLAELKDTSVLLDIINEEMKKIPTIEENRSEAIIKKASERIEWLNKFKGKKLV